MKYLDQPKPNPLYLDYPTIQAFQNAIIGIRLFEVWKKGRIRVIQSGVETNAYYTSLIQVYLDLLRFL